MSAQQESPGTNDPKGIRNLSQVSEDLTHLEPGQFISIELPAPGAEEREAHQKIIASLTSRLEEIHEDHRPITDNIIILTSNSPLALDPELQARLGRIQIDLPNLETRAQVLLMYAEKKAGLYLDQEDARHLAAQSDALHPLIEVLSRAAEKAKESGGTITREIIDEAWQRES